MLFLYNSAIYIYYSLIVLVSPFNTKAKLWLKGRKNWQDNLAQKIDKQSQTVWIHCSSLGEFEQGRPLIEALKIRYPNIKVLLSFFSPSGYEIRKNYPGADYIIYLPIDTRYNARKLIRLVNPIAAIFVKYEFWFHYLNELKKQNIPTYIISAIFRDEQVFFKSYGKWYKHFLFNFTHFFVQTQHSLELLNSIGIHNVTVTGDTRFDRVAANVKSAKEIPLLEEFKANSKIFICGSTWPKDEELILDFFKKNSDKIKLIIAPHEINHSAIERLRKKVNVESILFTKPEEGDPATARFLIIDTIGVLASAYRYGNIAYIGGGFGAGIHNTLEAAAFGLPIIFGPNYRKFQEAYDLLEMGAAFSVSNSEQLNLILARLMGSEEYLKECGAKCRDYIEHGLGASNLIIRLLEKDFSKFPNL